MSKAYDRIEWNFLEVVLTKFEFDVDCCNIAMDCVRSLTFSVLINGRPSKKFSPCRGIRQDDPLSPYLFILCAEVFSHLLKRAEENVSLRGIKVPPTAPSVNHLLFVDNCVNFSRATIHDVEAIQEALRVYELSSSQKVNFDKITLSFNKGVEDSRRGEIEHKLVLEWLMFKIDILAYLSRLAVRKKSLQKVSKKNYGRRFKDGRG